MASKAKEKNAEKAKQEKSSSIEIRKAKDDKDYDTMLFAYLTEQFKGI